MPQAACTLSQPAGNIGSTPAFQVKLNGVGKVVGRTTRKS
jgi:hypothetical protein